MDLKLDSEEFRAALAQTVMAQLTPEKREALLQAAVVNVLGETLTVNNRAGNNTSLFHQLFTRAVTDVAFDIVKAALDEPANKERIRTLALAAFDRAFVGDPSKGDEGVVDKIARTISRGFQDNNNY